MFTKVLSCISFAAWRLGLATAYKGSQVSREGIPLPGVGSNKLFFHCVDCSVGLSISWTQLHMQDGSIQYLYTLLVCNNNDTDATYCLLSTSIASQCIAVEWFTAKQGCARHSCNGPEFSQVSLPARLGPFGWPQPTEACITIISRWVLREVVTSNNEQSVHLMEWQGNHSS